MPLVVISCEVPSSADIPPVWMFTPADIPFAFFHLALCTGDDQNPNPLPSEKTEISMMAPKCRQCTEILRQHRIQRECVIKEHTDEA